MLGTLAALKAAKKNALFAPSSITHTGVDTAGLPHPSNNNIFSRRKYLIEAVARIFT